MGLKGTFMAVCLYSREGATLHIIGMNTRWIFSFKLKPKAIAELLCRIYPTLKLTDSSEECLPTSFARQRWTYLISLNCKVEALVFDNVVKTVASVS